MSRKWLWAAERIPVYRMCLKTIYSCPDCAYWKGAHLRVADIDGETMTLFWETGSWIRNHDAVLGNRIMDWKP